MCKQNSTFTMSTSSSLVRNFGGRNKMLFNLLPTFIVVGVQFLTRQFAPLCHRHAQRRLKHKRLRSVGHTLRSQLGIRGSLKASVIGSVRCHHRMQRSSARIETALFCLVTAQYQAHEFAHAITMIVRWPKGALLHRPSWRKYNEIGNGRSVAMARTRKHRKNTWILQKIKHIFFFRFVFFQCSTLTQ